jgi:hypothetical protein
VRSRGDWSSILRWWGFGTGFGCKLEASISILKEVCQFIPRSRTALVGCSTWCFPVKVRSRVYVLPQLATATRDEWRRLGINGDSKALRSKRRLTGACTVQTSTLRTSSSLNQLLLCSTVADFRNVFIAIYGCRMIHPRPQSC